ncbi:MBL fold metallo-hydrolase [Herbaspirillum lusitanum]|uniref:MBL fold metallo-hydrolase n=1 Tax=Herbaspirillum lusitanum TaxID=213312 RepID=A0ABW9A695_9BURK
MQQTPVACVQHFFDANTSTFSYVVYVEDGGECAIIDPVLDYDAASARTSTASADKLIDFIEAHGLKLQWLLETHAHADHVSAAPYLKQKLGGKIAIGERIREVQKVFGGIYNMRPEAEAFDHLFSAGELFNIGTLRAQALHVPGHTPADAAYLIEGSMAFVGDTMFMPDVGTARCDFPGGSAATLYASIRHLLAMPPATALFLCHDYPPTGREVMHTTTVAEQRAHNIHVKDEITEAEFIAMRTRRDATLKLPTLMLPAIQMNIQAGQLPAEESNGTRYLKLPMNLSW